MLQDCRNPWIVLALGALVLVLAAALAAQPESGKPPEPPGPLPPGAAAVVNGEIISLEEVHEALFKQYGQGILDQMIKAKLAQQEASRVGVAVDQKEVDGKVEEWKKNFLGRFNNDERAAEEMLARQGASLESTLSYMRQYHTTENLWAQLVRHRRKPDLASLQQAFEQRYGTDGEKFDVAHIVLSININDERYADRYTEREHYLGLDQIEENARQLAAQIAARAAAGEDFGKLAEQHSDDWSKTSGGKLGEFWKNRFGKEFEAAVENGAMGDVVGPFPVREGIVVGRIEPAEYESTFTARHIFLAFAKNDRDAVLAAAAALKAELDGGADFAELARTRSEDPLTRDRGGLWEPFTAKERVAQISGLLENLEPGKVTEPIATRFGVHLIQLVKKERTPKGDKKGAAIVLVSTQYPKVRENVLKPAVEQAARERAAELIKKLHAGADFAALAREHSDEKYTGERGGVIQGYNRQRISPEFHACVQKLAPGQVAPEPILTSYGYHVVKLLGREKTDFEKVKDELFAEEQHKPPSPVEVQRLQELLTNTAEIARRK
ncbi:MAG: peptidylprolyl isomerase [Planctomycetes bacterium]|nr:peptidylprolyl isomerase [Planctomycetota bacterium]